jgi:predicted nucleotidyltransferase
MKLSLEEVRERLHAKLSSLRQEFSVKSLAVFGSVARRDPQANALDLLGVKVDLVMADGLKPRVSQRVLQETVAV